jgi:CRP-like cAMP-binding protein
MSVESSDSAGLLDRALDFATANLRVERLLIQLGLDPDNVTYGAIFDRLFDLALAAITLPNTLALIAGIFLIASFMVRTIVPMRVLNIVSIVFFLAAAVLAGSVPRFFMYFLALPVNVVRLVQIRNLVKRARSSQQGTLSLDWLRPYMTPRFHQKGDVLFRKGDPATEMFLTVSGKFLVTEIGIEIPPERILGELGFLSPDNHRTQSVECIESGEVLAIAYDKLLEIYMDNPEFGYFFLRLTSDRLLQNHARLEGLVEQAKAELAAAKAAKARSEAEADGPLSVKGFAKVAMWAAARLRAIDSDAEQNASDDTEVARRRLQALVVIGRHANYAAAGGFIPVPFANEAALLAINMRMVRALYDLYDKPFEHDRAHALVVGLMGGVIPARLAAIVSVVPGYNLVGLAVASMTASAYVRRVGRMLLNHFEREAALERERIAMEEFRRSNIWFNRLARGYRNRYRSALEYGMRLARNRRGAAYQRAE